MQTLTVDPMFPFIGRPYAPTQRAGLGSGAVQLRRQYARPFFEFSFKLKFRDVKQAEEFSGFALYHQGDRAFWFDGGPYGNIANPVLIGYGDNTTTQFFAPRRNLFAPSWVVYVNGAATSVTIVESSGLIIFGSPPATNAVITGKGRNKFKSVFYYDQPTMFEMAAVFRDYYNVEEVTLREIA